MLYVWYGEERHRARAAAGRLRAALLQKRPDAHEVRVAADTLREGELAALARGRGLFAPHYIVTLDCLAETKEGKAALCAAAPLLAASPHVFLVIEGVLDKETQAALAPHAREMKECAAPAAARGTQEAPRAFALADALAARDRKGLWVKYREALARGASPEELQGVLFWQAKCLLLAARVARAQEAGLSPRVFAAARRGASRYTEQELRALLWRLLQAPHEVRRRGGSLEVALERILLSI